jgi:hypothetical protein
MNELMIFWSHTFLIEFAVIAKSITILVFASKSPGKHDANLDAAEARRPPPQSERQQILDEELEQSRCCMSSRADAGAVHRSVNPAKFPLRVATARVF